MGIKPEGTAENYLQAFITHRKPRQKTLHYLSATANTNELFRLTFIELTRFIGLARHCVTHFFNH